MMETIAGQGVSEKQFFFDFQVFYFHARRYSKAIFNGAWSGKATQQVFAVQRRAKMNNLC
jgi:hypothetical protein